MKKQSNLETKDIVYDLNLDKSDEITDIDLIENDRLLFTIKNNNKTYGVIYDINTKNIIKIDKKND